MVAPAPHRKEQIEDFKEGDEVIMSWKEDEGGGGYSNKRKKRGTIHFDEMGMYVETHLNPKVRLSDITAIRLL
jgi:hypothetical protein